MSLSHHLRVVIAIVVPLCVPTGSSAISLLFDYSYDSLGFFGGSNTNRRDTLEAAASFFETYLNDDLLALDAASSGNPANTWAARFTDPSDGSSIRAITNLVVPSDTLTIFVGARDLPGAAIGQGGPGGVWVYGTAAWLETVIARGESGALGPVTNDFGPWGGALSFDSAVEWYFDDDVSTLEAFPSLNDFYSVGPSHPGTRRGASHPGVALRSRDAPPQALFPHLRSLTQPSPSRRAQALCPSAIPARLR